MQICENFSIDAQFEKTLQLDAQFVKSFHFDAQTENFSI